MSTPLASHDQKVMLHLSCTESCLNLRNAVVSLMMLLGGYDTDASENGIKVPQHHVASHVNCLDLRNLVVPLMTLSASMMSYDQNSNVVPHFDCLDLRNTMVPLMELSRPHDADNNAVASHDSNTNAIDSM